MWEIGVGIAPIVFPDYRGSDQQSIHVLPFPYIIYRGERIKLTQDGLSGVLFDTERLELNISISGALPVDSDDNDARAGMNDLDPTVEIGPALKIHLTDEDAELSLRLNIPLRAVIAIDLTHLELNHVGWVLHPQLWLDLPELHGWSTSIGIGPLFADDNYHDYYYGVSPAFATASRPAYEGKAGYSGISVVIGTNRRFGQLWVGAFLRYDNLSGVAFEDSPLFETEHVFIAGAAIAWIFWQSEASVPAN